jgi:ubiquinone/menaquinone biosynthesis C-methylase UbiE
MLSRRRNNDRSFRLSSRRVIHFHCQGNHPDLGAGSGRLAAMVAGRVKAVRLLDSSQHMLDIARQRMEGLGHENCTYHVAGRCALTARA